MNMKKIFGDQSWACWAYKLLTRILIIPYLYTCFTFFFFHVSIVNSWGFIVILMIVDIFQKFVCWILFVLILRVCTRTTQQTERKQFISFFFHFLWLYIFKFYDHFTFGLVMENSCVFIFSFKFFIFTVESTKSYST